MRHALARLYRPGLLSVDFRGVDAALLAEKGISVLLLDVDGTLAPHGAALPSPDLLRWLDALRDKGIRCFAISNAGARRMRSFCGTAGLPYLPRAGKPSSKPVRTVLAQLGAHPSEAALLGDQLFTDIACARKAGVLSILVRPIPGSEPLQVRLKRGLERIVLRKVLSAEERLRWRLADDSESTTEG